MRVVVIKSKTNLFGFRYTLLVKTLEQADKPQNNYYKTVNEFPFMFCFQDMVEDNGADVNKTDTLNNTPGTMAEAKGLMIDIMLTIQADNLECM